MLAPRTLRRNDSTVTSRAEGHQANLDRNYLLFCKIDGGRRTVTHLREEQRVRAGIGSLRRGFRCSRIPDCEDLVPWPRRYSVIRVQRLTDRPRQLSSILSTEERQVVERDLEVRIGMCIDAVLDRIRS
ncbi:MAG TPA: hypothetical protein VG125_25080, partial [Pirellulales bacterium]|nr:hypothetical protein [Pirellulales bacterium]